MSQQTLGFVFRFFFSRMRLTRRVQFHTEFGVPLDTHRSNYTEEIFHRIPKKIDSRWIFFFFLFLSLHFPTKKNNGHQIPHFMENSAFIERTKKKKFFNLFLWCINKHFYGHISFANRTTELYIMEQVFGYLINAKRFESMAHVEFLWIWTIYTAI